MTQAELETKSDKPSSSRYYSLKLNSFMTTNYQLPYMIMYFNVAKHFYKTMSSQMDNCLTCDFTSLIRGLILDFPIHL